MVDELRIIQIATGVYPELKKKIKNPLRNDDKGSCFFKHHRNYIRLHDYSDPLYHMANCWDLLALSLWGRRIESAEDMKELKRYLAQTNGYARVAPPVKKDDFKTTIRWELAPLPLEFEQYVLRYGIERSHLIEDRLSGVKWYEYNFEEAPDVFKRRRPQPLHALLTIGDRGKLYQPGSKLKFMTNFSKNDYWFWNNEGPTYLCGSWKDGRVVANMGFRCAAFQSESMLPDDLSPIYNGQFLWVGDIDPAGLKLTAWACDTISKRGFNIKPVDLRKVFHRDEDKDISDIRAYDGSDIYLKPFLKQYHEP